MKNTKYAIGMLAAGCCLAASAHAAELKVGFVVSLSGAAAAQGSSYTLGMSTAAATIPAASGNTIKLITLDDASDPAAAARNARKLVDEDHVDILIGSSSVPGSLAVAAVARETKTPHIVMAPVNLPQAERGWTYAVVQPTPLEVDALLRHMKRSGVHSLGYMGFSDAWGDLFYSVLTKAAPSRNIQVVSNERYARTDSSVTGQTLKVLATHPDAVVTGTAGSAGALPYLALSERSYTGLKYASSALVNTQFVHIAGASIEGMYAPTGPGTVADQLPESNPIRKVAMDFRAAYQKVHGKPPQDSYAALAFDAWLLLSNAASRVSPAVQPGTPEFKDALRDAIASTHELVGVNGVYNFRPGEVFGMDERGCVIVRMENGVWKLQQTGPEREQSSSAQQKS